MGQQVQILQEILLHIKVQSFKSCSIVNQNKCPTAESE